MPNKTKQKIELDNSLASELQSLTISSQNGDKIAYKNLLLTIDKLAFAYCRQALPSEVMAEDCKQDILISVHKMLHTYDPKRPFLAWFYTITKNKVIDYYRKEGRRKGREVISSEKVELGFENANQEKYDSEIAVKNLLGRLSDEFKEPLVLSKLYGYSTKDIAEKLNISESLVKVRIFRGLRRLKDILKKETANYVTKQGIQT